MCCTVEDHSIGHKVKCYHCTWMTGPLSTAHNARTSPHLTIDLLDRCLETLGRSLLFFPQEVFRKLSHYRQIFIWHRNYIARSFAGWSIPHFHYFNSSQFNTIQFVNKLEKRNIKTRKHEEAAVCWCRQASHTELAVASAAASVHLDGADSSRDASVSIDGVQLMSAVKLT